MDDDNAKKTCQRCGRSYRAKDQFYKKRDGSRIDLCKNCLTLWLDIFDPETFKYILKDLDVPYIPAEWNVTRDKCYADNPNLKPYVVLGRYLSKMKMKQFASYGYEDSELIQEEYANRERLNKQEKKVFEEEMKNQYEKGEIPEAQYKTMVSTEYLYNNTPVTETPEPPAAPNPYTDSLAFVEDDILPDPTLELTKEDKIYLAVKWGKTYNLAELLELEKDYNNMTKSFDIQDADTRNTLIFICKTNLKMNQCLDSGDFEGFQKLSKVSESLRKSAKFTAAQNKEDKEDFVDSVGELISLCEREGGFIPRFPTNIPQDKVDATLKDMNDYVKKLVTQDLGFGKQIENALKKIQIQKEMEKDMDKHTELEDQDFIDFHQEIENQKQEDYKQYHYKDEGAE